MIGKSPDGLTLEERLQLAGKWIAIEIYDPVTLPLRQIVAIGSSATDCARQLASRGLDPTRFEYIALASPHS